jgi:TPR repeat protein
VFERLQPPEFDQARDWLHCEAEAGNTDAVVGLVLLLAPRLHPPDLDQARHWLEKPGRAAEAGDRDGVVNQGFT